MTAPVRLATANGEPVGGEVDSSPDRNAIAAMMPWLSESERDTRARLRRCHALAARRAASANASRARSLFWTAADCAAQWTFAPATLSDLEDVRRACLLIFLAANRLERAEAGL